MMWAYERHTYPIYGFGTLLSIAGTKSRSEKWTESPRREVGSPSYLALKESYFMEDIAKNIKENKSRASH